MAANDKSNSALASSAMLVRHLARPAAFPHAVDKLEVLETHISWIILTGTYAYKIKKPLDLGFLDFSTLQLRKHFCEEELRLNQRFAPEIYIDVVAIGGNPEYPAIGSDPTLDWAVRMHQFPAEARLDRQLQNNLLSADDMRMLGESVSRTHEQANTAPKDGVFGAVETVCKPTTDNFKSLKRDCTEPRLQQQLTVLEQWNTAEIERLGPALQERLATGRIRECHGDLHLANLVRIGDRILAFDCLEFSPALRWIDVMSEVGFLVMDTVAHERTNLAYSFLNRYLEESGDYRGITVLPFYLVYRCLVRAKVAAVRHRQSGDSSDLEMVRLYIDQAMHLVRPSRKAVLIITHGLSGSGKTWLTNKLMSRIPAIRVRSDLERKRIHGLAGLESSDSTVAGGIYSQSDSAETYARLTTIAEISLAAGFDTIIDAAFLQRDQRSMFSAIAGKMHLQFVVLDCRAKPDTLRQRVAARTAAGIDASEADLAVLEYQLESAMPIDKAESADIIRVDTESDPNIEAIVRAIRTPRAHDSTLD